MPLVCVGLSHRTAPLDIRERLALRPADCHQALTASWFRDAARESGVGELVLLSTCNRTELYAAGLDPSVRFREVPDGLADLLVRVCRVPGHAAAPFLSTWAGSDAARHLCAVASGLESLVLGETDVLGQVAEAHDLARRTGVAGPILGAAFHTALRAGRRARAETAISRHPASVASEAVRLIRERWRGVRGLRVVVVGTGRMGRVAAELLRAKGVADLEVVGRTLEHALALAAPLHATARPWHELAGALETADAVVAATAAPHPVITPELVRAIQARRDPRRVLQLVDIAVPRDVDPAVRGLPGVEVLDIDHLRERVEAHLDERAREIPLVHAIIGEELAHFEAWCQGATLRPVLAGLHARAESIRRHELDRALRRLGPLAPEVQRHLEAFSHALVRKLLDLPSRRLRSASDTGQARVWADAVQALFDLRGEGQPPHDREPAWPA